MSYFSTHNHSRQPKHSAVLLRNGNTRTPSNCPWPVASLCSSLVLISHSKVSSTPETQQSLTFTCPCIANIFTEYNQQDETFHNLFISVRHSTCFRQFFRPSSGAQNCTYSVRYLSDQYLTLYVQFWAPGDGPKNCVKHAEHLTEINKLRNVASCWLYCENTIKFISVLPIK